MFSRQILYCGNAMDGVCFYTKAALAGGPLGSERDGPHQPHVMCSANPAGRFGVCGRGILYF